MEKHAKINLLQMLAKVILYLKDAKKKKVKLKDMRSAQPDDS